MKMTDKELAALIEHQVANSVTESSEYTDIDEKSLQYYNGEKVGLLAAADGRSSVMSTDVLDLVESDMPSLARVFLGANDPVAFKPLRRTPESIKEAKQRNAFVSHIIKTMPDSFRTQHAFLKGSELQQLSALEYGCEEIDTTEEKNYSGVTEDELADVIEEIQNDKSVSKVDIVETSDDEEFDAVVRVTYTKKKWYMRFIPTEDFVISRNATCKDDAQIVGKRFRKTRGELVADGLSKEFVDKLPAHSNSENNTLRNSRFKTDGGDDSETGAYVAWANEEVQGVDCYALVDFDGDGIAERRHIIKVGNEIIENEPFGHVPFAISSSMLMPGALVGKSRSMLAMSYQEIQTHLMRQTMDNITVVNNPRTVVNDNVDIDDLLDVQFGGVIRTDGVPAQDLMNYEIPYIGDKALQIVAYMDGKKTTTTGAQQANQALQADNLHKETATRFEGLEDAAAAKIELVARVIAETGYRDLWEGIAWFAKHYQDEGLEMRVLGEPMRFNPKDWKYDHSIAAQVGTGAGDDEKTMQNLTAVYNAQLGLLQMGSPLVDQSKLYSTLRGMINTIGKDAVEEYFNNPEQPDQIVEAERDILKQQLQILQQQMGNPLAEAEQVKAQGQMQIKMMEQKFNAQMEQMKMSQDFNQKIEKALQERDSQLRDLQFKYDQLFTQTKYNYDKLEVENSTDIEGEGTE